ncbi:MAG: rod shape-determining protein MreC [Chloroflexota bacterium]
MTQRRVFPWWMTGSAIALLVALLLLPEPSRIIQSFAVAMISPVQAGVTQLIDDVSDVTGTVQRIQLLARENRDNRDEIDRLQAEMVRLQELELENRDLRNLLGLKQRSGPGELIPVRVIGRDPSPYVQAITIDRGSQDGVQNGLAVVTWRGLVGRVVRTEGTTSKVLLISDVNSSIMGRFQDPESRATGMVRGRPEGGLVMQHVPQDESIELGKVVISSDLGTIVPEGLVIGKVVQVRRKDVDVFQEAILEPSVDPAKLERLFVMSSARGDAAR